MDKKAPLIVHADWSRSWGGQEIRTMTELREMRKKGFRGCLMVPEDSELARRGKKEGFQVWPVEFKSKFHLASWSKIIGGLRSLKPDVVNTHSSEDSWMVGAAARIMGVPLVVRTRHVLASISSSFSYRFPHVILACSEAIRDGLIEQGVPEEKIIVQPTGIDEQRFRFSQEKRDEVRRKYGVAENEILVGNVGFFRIYKGQIFIVRTAAKMPGHFKFMLVGDGQDRPQLEAEIKRLGIENRFILTDHQEHPEDFISAFDLLFFASWSTEGIAQSYIQCLLYGMPLLVCRTPSMLEPLEYVQKYEVIDYDDLDGAREALRKLSNDIIRDEESVENQRQALARQYGLNGMVRNLLQVYSQHGVTSQT